MLELAQSEEQLQAVKWDLVLARAHSLTKDEVLVHMLQEGFSNIWKDLTPEPIIEFPDPMSLHNHQCEDTSLLFRGVEPLDRSCDKGIGPVSGPRQHPLPDIKSTDGVEICASCKHHRGRPWRMHKLPCGHYFCRLCLQHRASTSMGAGPRGTHADMKFEESMRRVGRQMYGFWEPDYVGGWEGKNDLILGLWVRLGWTCCGQPIPFIDFIRRGCLHHVNAVKHLDLWSRAVRIITTIGGRIILEMLDPFMELEIEGNEEVAVLHVEGKKKLVGLEALDGIKYINPFERTESNPAGWTSHVPCLSAISEARVKKDIEEERTLRAWIG